jgi:hypothetical protein
MRRHIKHNNIIFFVIVFESFKIIAFITVKNKEAFYIFYLAFSMLVKMLNLFII